MIQINIQMQCFNFLVRPTTAKKRINSQEALEANLDRLCKYLSSGDIVSLKLTCRPFYYYFVTAQLWLGLKLNVAQEKLQYFDDFEFEEQPQTKLITKKDKNIRIHSLKKQAEERNKNMPKREPSNIKEKGKIMNENNQLLLRNTEIGFKRLLKTNSKRKIGEVDFQLKQINELPKVTSISDYIIKISDPWSLNMSRAQNLIIFFKKLNEFHHKFTLELKLSSKQIQPFAQKVKKLDEKANLYISQSSPEPYASIIKSVEGAKQNLLIDDQLNKVCRLFLDNHSALLKLKQQLGPFRQILERQKIKFEQILSFTRDKNCKASVQYLENINNLDESIGTIGSFLEENRELGQLVMPQIVVIYSTLAENFQTLVICFEDNEQQLQIEHITWASLARRPFFTQTLLQIIVNLASKLVKLSGSLCPDDITLSITLNRLKNMKNVSQSLLNVSKYFGKLKKQIEEKQKKGKEGRTSEPIKQFIGFYQSKEDEGLYLIKNTQKLDKIIGEFKQKINNMKTKIQST